MGIGIREKHIAVVFDVRSIARNKVFQRPLVSACIRIEQLATRVLKVSEFRFGIVTVVDKN